MPKVKMWNPSPQKKEYLYRTATLKKHMQMLPGLWNENECKTNWIFTHYAQFFILIPTEKYRKDVSIFPEELG